MSAAEGDKPTFEGPPDTVVWRTLQAAAVLLVLAAFLYSVRGVLSPFVLFWVLIAVLVPFRGTRSYTVLTLTVAAVTVYWILETVGFVLAPFVLALVLSYILDPMVDRLSRGRIPRSAAIVLLFLPVVGALALAIFWGIPAAGQQISDLIERAPTLLTRLADWLDRVMARVLVIDLPLIDEQSLVDRVRQVDSEQIVAWLEGSREAIAGSVRDGILGVGRGVGSVLTVAGYVILTPVLSFYLLRDWDRLVGKIDSLLPRPSRDGIVAFFRQYDRLLSAYLRGQVTVALTVGLITAFGLWVLRFPFAFLVGSIVAVFSVVPYVGLLISIVPAVVIALTSGSVLASLIKVVVVFGIAQGLEGTVISPRIVGSSTDMHPVLVVLALAIGGFFFGFVGLLIGVPLGVGVKLLAERGVEVYRRSSLYLGTSDGSA